MYSILNKEGRSDQIIHFLADSDNDLITIIDTCDAGSTVEVLSAEGKEGAEGVHSFIKTPSGNWTLYKGESDYKMPVNDAGVFTFPATAESPASLDGATIDTYQQGVQIYPSGYVTGTLHNARMISNTTKDNPDRQVGHFIILGLSITDPKNTYDLYDGDKQIQTNLKPLPANDYLLVRYEKLEHPEKLKVKYTNGESFVFDLTGLVLE